METIHSEIRINPPVPGSPRRRQAWTEGVTRDHPQHLTPSRYQMACGIHMYWKNKACVEALPLWRVMTEPRHMRYSFRSWASCVAFYTYVERYTLVCLTKCESRVKNLENQFRVALSSWQPERSMVFFPCDGLKPNGLTWDGYTPARARTIIFYQNHP